MSVKCEIKKDSKGRVWYTLFFGDRPGVEPLQGPYRDKTDAENAAQDEAKRRGWEIEAWYE